MIIPVYNVEQYIGQCLDSLISQSYTSLEIILVNDGSTDDSPRICEQYAQRDSRIRVIHKANGGQASARNEGIRLAKGEYLSFIDSDDWVEPTMYEEAMAEFVQDEHLSVVRFGLRECYPDGLIEEEHCPKCPALLEGENILKAYGTPIGLNGVMCTAIYKRSVFDNYKLMYLNGIVHEDEVLSLQMCFRLAFSNSRERVKVLRNIIRYNYRKGISSTVSHLTLRHLKDFCFGLVSIYKQTMMPNAYSKALLDSKVLYLISRFYYKSWVQAGISWSDIKVEIRHLSSYLSLSCLLDDRETRNLYRLFCYSPRLFHYVEMIYAPLARRLGVSIWYV